MKILIYILFMFSSACLVAQSDNYTTLKKLNAALLPSGKTISYTIDMAYFEPVEGTKAMHTLHVETIMNAKEYWANIDGNEYYGNREWDCVVNHTEKAIYLSVNGQGVDNILPDFEMIEALAKDQGLELSNFDKGENKGIRFMKQSDSKTKVDILYAPQTFLPQKAIIKIDVDDVSNAMEFNHCRIEMSYSDYQFPKGNFPYSLKSYLRKTSNGFVPVSSLAHYQIYSF